MTEECKHGLKNGCSYCHARIPAPTTPRIPAQKRRPRGSGMSEKMNDRMTALARRLKAIRGET